MDKGDNTCFRLVLLVRSLGGKQQQRRPSRRRLRRSRFFPRRLFLRRRPRRYVEVEVPEEETHSTTTMDRQGKKAIGRTRLVDKQLTFGLFFFLLLVFFGIYFLS